MLAWPLPVRLCTKRVATSAIRMVDPILMTRLEFSPVNGWAT